MAQFAVERSVMSVVAFGVMLLFGALIIFATATSTKLGGMLYLVGLAAIVMGFWTKEDSAAIGGVIGICFVVILDIIAHIGLLG